MHFTFYLGDSGRLGLNLQFKSDVKSGLRPDFTSQIELSLTSSCFILS